MAAINFGYTISKPRAIDIDRNNLRKSDEILREMPELQTCIGCGACTAVCTAGNLTEFNFRKVHTLVRRGEASVTMTDKIDRVVLNRWLGLPIFLAIMYVMFLFTQNFGAAFIDFFDIFVGGVAVDGFGQLLESIGCPEWLKVILADGIGGGIQTVSTFIPVIFFCLMLR